MTGRVERTSVSTTFWRSCPSNGRRRLTYQWNRGARAPRSSTAARAFPSSFLSLLLPPGQAFLRRRRRGCARTASRGRSATSSADRRTTAGREDPSGGGGEFLLRERRDERRYGEESEQGSTSAVEVAGVATPPRSILDSRPELEGCAPRDGWRKLGTRPRRHGVRAGRWYTTWVVVCDRFLERWGMVVEGEECGRVMGQWILYEIIYSNYEFV